MNRRLLTTILILLANLRPAFATEAERTAPTGMEWWRLRSAEALATTDVLTTGATSVGPARKPPASEIPEARRAVRVVYPGLVDTR